jgi:hypothetical protein
MEREAELKRRYTTSRELAAQGWTRTQIHKLGKPDLIKSFWSLAGSGVRYFWLRARLPAERPPLRLAKQPEVIDVLAATFVTNRAAKRWRDHARRAYLKRQHAQAENAKTIKETLYALKDRGIAWAVQQGRLSGVIMQGGLAVYRGEGYCFHSRLLPVGVEFPVLGEERIYVEAKPRGSRDPRLCDARITLEALPEVDQKVFRVLAPPEFRRTEKTSPLIDEAEEADGGEFGVLF